MKTLLLLRHGETPFSDPDHARVLSKWGHEQALKTSAWVHAEGYAPQAILSSDATRTRETVAPFLAHDPDCSVRFTNDLYLASPKQMFEVVEKAETKADTLLLCAHNPGISQLDTYLTNLNFRDYPPAGLAVIQFEIDDWAELTGGSGTVIAQHGMG